jgi:hypothetical protein
MGRFFRGGACDGGEPLATGDSLGRVWREGLEMTVGTERLRRHLPDDGLILLVVTLVSVSLPFLMVRFVPSTDMPQQLAQVRLLTEVLAGQHQTTLALNWGSPNVLVYALLFVFWQVAPPVLAGRLALLSLTLAWALACFALARARHRSWLGASLASGLVFNMSLYWGFLSFLVGWPCFVWWLTLIGSRNDGPARWRQAARLAICALLLYLSHALWLALGLIVWVVLDWRRWKDLRAWMTRGALVLPEVLLALVWFPHFAHLRAEAGFDTGAHWVVPIWRRLDPRTMLDGIRGWPEGVLLAGIAVYVVAGLLTHRDRPRCGMDPLLLGMALLVGGVALAAPDQYMNTTLFALRWWAVALALLAVAAPAPRFSRALLLSGVIGVSFAFSLATATAWIRFNAIELSGASESLGVIPRGSRVLGLDYVRSSKYIHGRPFMQFFAYAQVLRGGTLNFSFTQHYSGIVVDAHPWRRPWTRGIEWYAERASLSDLSHFDIVLANGLPDVHADLATSSALDPLSTHGRWRAYRCHATPAAR